MRLTSRDGLMSSIYPESVALYESIVDSQAATKASWTNMLREAGVKLAHPDDGWVHRERNVFSLSWYPQFNDRPEVGDLMAFGWPLDDGQEPSYGTDKNGCAVARYGYRLVRVTDVRREGVLIPMTYYHYEDTGLRLPPPPPPPSRVSKLLGWLRPSAKRASKTRSQQGDRP